MKKIYTLLAAVSFASLATAQVTLPYSETFSYADGDLNGKGNWTVQSANATDKILVQGGLVKFDGAGEDLKSTITPTNSGTIYYAMDLNVTSITAATLADGGYLAGFGQDNTTFGGTLWTKKVTETTYKLGVEVRTGLGAFTTWTSADYTINQVNNVVVSYTFNTSGTSDDTVNLYVNGVLAASDTHTGTDLTAINAIFLRQDSTTETPFVAIDNLKVTTNSTEVLAVSDMAALKANFVQNTVVNDGIKFGVKSDVKVYNMNGQVVKSAPVEKGSTLNVSSLPKGIYIVTGNVDGQVVSQKITKN